MITSGILLQGMFWDHKVLPCMAKECGMINKRVLMSLWQFSLLFLLVNIVYNDIRWVLSTSILFIQPCTNVDCLYLHEFGPEEDSFTKDEIISAYTRYFHIVSSLLHDTYKLLSMLVLKHDTS